jgi:hypothetical protein
MLPAAIRPPGDMGREGWSAIIAGGLTVFLRGPARP